MATQAEILKQALTLPPEARAALADSLLDSLDTEVDEDAAEQWRVEIRKRMAELDAGTVEKTCGSGSVASAVVDQENTEFSH